MKLVRFGTPGSEKPGLLASHVEHSIRVAAVGLDTFVTTTGRVVERCTDDRSTLAAASVGRPWRIERVYGASDWLRAEEPATGRSFRLVLQTPFLWWPSCDATLLPGTGVVVYALGPHVVALDLDTRRLAVLAEGTSPLVTLDDAP